MSKGARLHPYYGRELRKISLAPGKLVPDALEGELLATGAGMAICDEFPDAINSLYRAFFLAVHVSARCFQFQLLQKPVEGYGAFYCRKQLQKIAFQKTGPLPDSLLLLE